MPTTSGTSAARSRGSRASTQPTCAARCWPAARAPTSTGRGRSASCPFISRYRPAPPTGFSVAIGTAAPWGPCRDWLRRHMEDATMIASPPTRFRWLERGDGEPVVMLHGLMGEMDQWESTLEALGPFRRPIALELPIFDPALTDVSVP